MKILISSHFFSPSLGGIEQVSETLANEFSALGHEVRIVTQTPAGGPAEKSFPYPVHRKPSLGLVRRQLAWCDIYFQSNISLATIWLAFLFRCPTVVVYHTWMARIDGRTGWQDKVKRLVSQLVEGNIAVSGAMAKTIPARSEVIPNPYRDDVFRLISTIPRDLDLVFVGRLVSDKGCDLLLESLVLLKRRDFRVTLTIVGSGPEEERLQEICRRNAIQGQVTFVGAKKGRELAEILNRHRVLIVPSRWQEPFGIVALEGIACGCVVIGSEGGGLPEAIGPCGLTFPNGDGEALANAIGRVLSEPESVLRMQGAARKHLEKHRAVNVASRYVEVFERVMRGGHG